MARPTCRCTPNWRVRAPVWAQRTFNSFALADSVYFGTFISRPFVTDVLTSGQPHSSTHELAHILLRLRVFVDNGIGGVWGHH